MHFAGRGGGGTLVSHRVDRAASPPGGVALGMPAQPEGRDLPAAARADLAGAVAAGDRRAPAPRCAARVRRAARRVPARAPPLRRRLRRARAIVRLRRACPWRRRRRRPAGRVAAVGGEPVRGGRGRRVRRADGGCDVEGLRQPAQPRRGRRRRARLRRAGTGGRDGAPPLRGLARPSGGPDPRPRGPQLRLDGGRLRARGPGSGAPTSSSPGAPA